MADASILLSVIATAIGIIGSITAALSWINKKSEQRMALAIEKALSPLTYQMKSLNDNLCDAKEDRKDLRRESKLHDNRLDNHETRISILEKS